MLNSSNTCTVTDFERNPKVVLSKLQTSGAPVVLTVDGKAELIVQDAASYQQLLDKVAAAEDLEAVRRGLEQSLAGQGRSASDFFEEFEARHDL